MTTLRLHVHDGARSATLLFSRFPVLVGRDPCSDCRLEFPRVSRVHASIDLRGGRLTLCDEGSSLGTWVRNQSRRLPVGVHVDLESVASEFWVADLRVHAELLDPGPLDLDPAALDAAAVAAAALRALQELASRYVPDGPPLTGIEAVSASFTRLDDLIRMLTHHRPVFGEASPGLQRALERLNPEAIENDPRCRSRWGPWRYQAYWAELKRRASALDPMGERSIGPGAGGMAKPLRERQSIPASVVHALVQRRGSV